MREWTKTLIFVAVALLLTGAAFVSLPKGSRTDATFNDQGQPFFPDFKDPLACTDLEVIDYDASTATASRFEVKQKEGKWVIPSHNNYPADAKDRLAKTASGVMNLTKDTIRSDRAEDHAELGVIDPIDPKATSLKGRGKRITLRDKTEKALADFIIGKEVRERPGQRYVRVPGQKRTYGVNVKVDLSTRFADWIETNLLKLDTSKIRRVKFDNHKVDPEQGRIIPGDVLTIERKDASGPWTLVGDAIPEGQELDSDKIQALTTALGDLKIDGVRPKPEGLSNDLKLAASGEIKPTTNQGLTSLVSKGFYPTRTGLYSNQGDVVVSTDEGVEYTLRYGEVFIASGLELSAGSEDDAKKGDKKKAAEGSTEHRYLFVTAAFDPTLVPPVPPAEEKPKLPAELPDDPFQKAPNDPKRIEEEKKAKEEESKAKAKADRDQADFERRVEDGKKRVQELTDRFADWYYVTPGESFHAIVLDRPALIHPKQAKASEPSLPPGMPSFPGFPHP